MSYFRGLLINTLPAENGRIIMNILDKIYEAYIAGDLNIKPRSQAPEEREAVRKFASECELTEEQASDLTELLLDTADRRGKEMFFAGIKLAAEFIKELSSDTEIGGK